tara:strand:+ start:722 stop:1573 length:852 start_codon:yes stop_codon:yes gene_type:complete
MSPTPTPRIVIVGNVSEDLTPEGAWIPGGPALYSARAAVALGADVTLVSRVPTEYDRSSFEGLKVVELPVATCPRYENVYPKGGGRRQTLHQVGGPIAAEDMPSSLSADAVIAAPALDELAEFPSVGAPLQFVSLQGMLRWAIPKRPVRRAAYAPSRARSIQPVGAISIFSDEDADDPTALATALSLRGPTVVTLGNRGACLYRKGSRSVIPAFPANVSDPTGAGDGFVAALAVRLVETGDLLESCTFGNAMGSLMVERSGLGEMPSREDVFARSQGEVAHGS